MKNVVVYYLLCGICAVCGLIAYGLVGGADQTPLTLGRFVGIVVFGGLSFVAGRAAEKIAQGESE